MIISQMLYRKKIHRIILLILTALVLLFLTTDIPAAEFQLLGTYGGSFNDVAVSGKYAYVGTEKSLLVFDITNHSSPELKAQYNIPPGRYNYISNVFISGNTLYIAAGPAGLIILSIKNPESLKHLSTKQFDGRYTYDVFVKGDKAYLANETRLTILDISNLSSPKYISSIKVPGRSLYISGNYAYVLKTDGKLSIIDVSDSSSPVAAGSISFSTVFAQQIFISGGDSIYCNL